MEADEGRGGRAEVGATSQSFDKLNSQEVDEMHQSELSKVPARPEWQRDAVRCLLMYVVFVCGL